MSRPIIEPSNPREIGNTKFRTSQLERRPAPTLSAVSEYAWASCTTSPTVPGPSALPVAIPWDSFSTTNTAVFSMGGSGDTSLTCGLPGSYLFEIKALFPDGVTGVAAVFFGTILNIDGSDGAWLAHNNLVYPGTPVCGASIGIRDFATAFIDQSGGFGPPKDAGVEMFNFCGPDCDLSIAYLKAVYVPSANDLTSVF